MEEGELRDQLWLGEWYRHQGRGMIGQVYRVYKVDETYVYSTHTSISGRTVFGKNLKKAFLKWFEREKPKAVQKPKPQSGIRYGNIQSSKIPWKLR
jgi:hypothetical protein